MVKKKEVIIISVIVVVVVIVLFFLVLSNLSFCRVGISVTSETGVDVRQELNKIWAENQEEVICIGEGKDPITLTPGKLNVIWCGIKADSTAEYKIELKEIESQDPGKLSNAEIKKWIEIVDKFRGNVSAGDESLKKFLRLNIPKDASRTGVVFIADITRDGVKIDEKRLSLKIDEMRRPIFGC